MHKQSFFEYLGIAGVEKIHSQVLAWLFSEDCDALDDEQKRCLLKRVFNVDSSIQNIRTEYGNIDILIETENVIIVIENKIKSSQHSNQLERYKVFCEQNFTDKEIRYCYLSLVAEDIESEGWLKISYQQIYDSINELSMNYSTKHGIIMQEYMLYLEKLVNVLRDFSVNYSGYEMVFIDGNKTKEEKRKSTYKNANEEFIAKNQLETILQKSFLYSLTYKIIPQPLISETRGTALVNFFIKFDIQLPERTGFETYLQMQGNIIKFVFAMNGRELAKSSKEWVKDVIPKMEDLSKNNEFGYSKLNKPESRAYVSISKKMEKTYWREDIEVLKAYIEMEIANGIQLTNKLLESLNIND